MPADRVCPFCGGQARTTEGPPLGYWHAAACPVGAFGEATQRHVQAAFDTMQRADRPPCIWDTFP